MCVYVCVRACVCVCMRACVCVHVCVCYRNSTEMSEKYAKKLVQLEK